MEKLEDLLVEIINGFAAKGIIFTNEQQFQFELALELKNRKYDVWLEALSLGVKWEEANNFIKTKTKKPEYKKTYTDIILRKENTNLYYAIELKMKTPNKAHIYDFGDTKYITMGQGAENQNSHAFYSDIERLENINKRYFFKDNIKVEQGYAILLTNFAGYKKNPRKDTDIWGMYALNEGKKVDQGKRLINSKEEHKSFKAVTLEGTYVLNGWHDYELRNNGNTFVNPEGAPNFQYLIVPVKPV